MKETEWYHYIRNVESGRNNQLNEDFEVLSFIAVTTEKVMNSVDDYLDIDTYDISRFRSQKDTLAYLINHQPVESNVYIVPTPIDIMEDACDFYQFDLPISIRDAIGLGLGVIRFLRGSKKGKVYFYSFVKNTNNQDRFVKKAQELERVKAYILLQLPYSIRIKGRDSVIQSAKEDLIFTDVCRLKDQLEGLEFN